MDKTSEGVRKKWGGPHQLDRVEGTMSILFTLITLREQIIGVKRVYAEEARRFNDWYK